MKKRELRRAVSESYKLMETRWNSLAARVEDDDWTFETILRDEPNSQLTRMVCWLYALDAALDSDEEATPFEIAVCERLPRIVDTLDDLAEDHDTFI